MLVEEAELGLGWPVEGVVVSAWRFTPRRACTIQIDEV